MSESTADTLELTRLAELEVLRTLVDPLWHGRGCTLLASTLLTPADFYNPLHGILFSVACQLDSEKEPVNILTISNRLRDTAQLEQFGSDAVSPAGAVTAILVGSETCNIPAFLRHYCKTVREFAIERERAAIQRDHFKMIEAGTSIEEAMAITHERLTYFDSNEDRLTTFADVAAGMEDYFKQLLQGRETIPAGFKELDELLRMEPGHVCVCGAYTSVGKTAFACAVIAHAIIANVRSGIISLEMEPNEIGKRIVGILGRFATSQWRPGAYISESLWKLCKEAISTLSRDDFYLEAPKDFRLSEIRSKVAAMTRAGARAVVIDYLQLIRTDQKTDSLRESILEVSRNLKLLAREFKVAIFTLAQLRREADTSARPALSHLQESAAIEQDADSVLLLHRPQKQEYDCPVEKATVIVAKNRHGRTGSVPIGFHRELGVFVDIDHDHHDN